MNCNTLLRTCILRPADSVTGDEHEVPAACRFWKTASGYLYSILIAFEHNFHSCVPDSIASIRPNHLTSLAIASALPGAFIFLSGIFPHSWATHHRAVIVDFLHLCLSAGFAPKNTGIQELVVAALVMVSFDMFQRALDWDTKTMDESDHGTHVSSAAETLVQLSCSAPSALAGLEPSAAPSQENKCQSFPKADSGVSNTNPAAMQSRDEIVRLQGALTELKTANKAKEVLLRRTREDLKSARETQNETFAEYCSLRDEMKSIKQIMARDHQAVVYRKDIELFALRKGNEQKEKYIKEHDAKLDDVFQQQKATVELKDAQLKILKERLAFMDRQSSPKFSHDQDGEMEGDHALQVRLLRVKTANNTTTFESPSVDEQKDATIVSLREQLAVTRKAADEVVNQQAELARAWDIVKKVQASLKEERKHHAQTLEKLQELTVKYEEEQQRSGSLPIGRLPTIEEDKDELEAMFDSTQQDNLRLYAELEALEQRLRDANSRMFNAEQEATILREQVEMEKAVSDDFETARPSVVHRVHFQRMEGQLKEVRICWSHISSNFTLMPFLQQSRDVLATKENEITLLKKTVAGKNDYVKDLQAEVDAAVNFHTQDQDEIERLKQNLAELQATKDHLMRDHERLSVQRTRLRMSSTEHTSARSSGTTLTQDLSPPLPKSTDEVPPIEALPVIALLPTPTESLRPNSIQETPKRHIRNESTPNRWSLMSNTAPPPELRGARRRSLGLKDFMKKMVKKDEKTTIAEDPEPVQQESTTETHKPRAALATRNANATMRPNTAAPIAKTNSQDPFFDTPTVAVPQGFRPANVRRHTPRYYAGQDAKEEEKDKDIERPQTAKESKDDSSKSKRRSWGAAT
jgi:hypothetical protein